VIWQRRFLAALPNDKRQSYISFESFLKFSQSTPNSLLQIARGHIFKKNKLYISST
jgi:hypothetical protein